MAHDFLMYRREEIVGESNRVGAHGDSREEPDLLEGLGQDRPLFQHLACKTKTRDEDDREDWTISRRASRDRPTN